MGEPNLLPKKQLTPNAPCRPGRIVGDVALNLFEGETMQAGDILTAAEAKAIENAIQHLNEIAHLSANSNSDPDTMGEALDLAVASAQGALRVLKKAGAL